MVANPKKLLYTVANPACGLLKREKKEKKKKKKKKEKKKRKKEKRKKSGSAPSPASRYSFGEN